LLTTPWEKTGAYEVGLIDAQGNKIKDPVTDDERSKYNLFHRLVFNLKKLINKIPLGKTTLASYLAALYLIKEELNISEESLSRILCEGAGFDLSACLNESTTWCSWNLNEFGELREGAYTLANTIQLPRTGEMLGLKNSRVFVTEDTASCGNIFGTPVFKVQHNKLGRHLFVTPSDLIR
jgi:hypothetical protein